MSFDPRSAMRKSIRHLKPYYKAPNEPMLRMDQNTNLIGRNPALARVGLDSLEFNQYPTRDSDRLLAAIEAHYALPSGTVLAGNGSDEVLDVICKAFTDPGDTLATPAPSYSLYPFYAALHDLRHQEVPVTDEWDIDVEGLLANDPKVILVASPNNPTGRAVGPAALDELLDRAPGLVVVDEAYQEYTGQPSMLNRIGDHRNLVVMRTFSKAFALAGARIGWLAAHPDTAEVLALAKPPFNVNVISEELGVRALDEGTFVQGGVDHILVERPRLTAALEERGFEVVPSDANFLLTFPPAEVDGPTLCDALKARGVATRVFPHVARLERSIRFTIGRREDNDRLLAELDATMGGPP